MGIKRRLDKVAERIVRKTMRLPGSRMLSKPTTISLIRGRVIELVYLAAIFILSAGVVNTVLEGSRPSIPQAFITLARGVQTWGETFMNLFSLLIGTAGLYMIYQSGKMTFRRRIATLYFLAGLAGVLISILIGFYILGVKRF